MAGSRSAAERSRSMRIIGRQIIYGTADAAGPIDRIDERQRLVSLLTGYERLTAGSNRVAEVEELPLERFHRNRHRIGCARRDAAAQRRRLSRLILHVPRRPLVPR